MVADNYRDALALLGAGKADALAADEVLLLGLLAETGPTRDASSRACPLSACTGRRPQNIILASTSPTSTATAVATSPGIMNEWFSTYLPILVVPDRSKLIAAISEP